MGTLLIARLRQVHRAYELAHIGAAVRGLALAAALTVLAIGLHRTTDTTLAGRRYARLLAGRVSAGAVALWRRGAFAGLLEGVPRLIAPSLVFALGHGGHCATCEQGATLPCLITCLGPAWWSARWSGIAATSDVRAPRRFASRLDLPISAAMTGLLGFDSTARTCVALCLDR